MIRLDALITNPMVEVANFKVYKEFNKKFFNTLNIKLQLFKYDYFLANFEFRAELKRITFQLALLGYSIHLGMWR